MTRCRTSRAWGICLGLMVGFLAPTGQAFAQEAEDPGPDPNGTEAFRAILNEQGFEPLDLKLRIYDDPSSTLVIILGDTTHPNLPVSDFDINDFLRHYLEEGGALLLASDRATPPLGRGHWVDEFNVQITGELVVTDTERDRFAESPNCPFVETESILDRLGGRQRSEFRDVFEPFDRIATNNPSLIRGMDPFAAAWHPYSATIGGSSGQAVNPLRESLAVGFVGLNGSRFGIMADHSIFINQMILHPDNQNLEFTETLVTWFKQGRFGDRTKCLFIEDGEIITNFNLRLAELPGPRLPPFPILVNMLAQTGNALIAEMQNKDFFNRTLLRGVPTSRLLNILLVILTLGLMFYGLRRIWTGRVRKDPLLTYKRTEEPPPLVNHLHARHEDVIDGGNFNEVARRQVREWLIALGGSPRNGSAPPVIAAGSYWRRRQIRREVQRIWDYAFGSVPGQLSARGWLRLRERLHRLGESHHQREWHFE